MKDDILEEIFSMQKDLADAMDLSRYPNDTQGRISSLCTAIMHEAVELQRTTNWKWWKTPVTFDTDHAKEELIDMPALIESCTGFRSPSFFRRNRGDGYHST